MQLALILALVSRKQLSHSIKFSRVKVFVDFLGQNENCEALLHIKLMQGIAGSLTSKLYHKNLFLSRIWQNSEVFALENYRLYSNKYGTFVEL